MKILNSQAEKYIFYALYSRYLVGKHVGHKRPRFDDREVLETIIFPYILSHQNPKKILDIGREHYQKFYNEFFFGRELWTLDRHKWKKRYGSQNHVTGNVKKLDEYFKKNQFDLVVMNGVFGWGLNKEKDIEKTFRDVYNILKKGGLFVLGWNDRPGLRPMLLKDIPALKKFKQVVFPPLSKHQFRCKTGYHTYNFYKKP